MSILLFYPDQSHVHNKKKIGYNGAAMYIHAYKLNLEYNLKNTKKYCILLDYSVYGLILDPAPYWNEWWLARLMISMRFSNVQKFELFPVKNKYTILLDM